MTNKKEKNYPKKLWIKLSQEQQQEIQGGISSMGMGGNGQTNGATFWPGFPPPPGHGG